MISLNSFIERSGLKQIFEVLFVVFIIDLIFRQIYHPHSSLWIVYSFLQKG
jgi:hypothetical protein